ncbi:MAG: hypothetical protein MJ245_03235 [Clostridia bacterium]|nr:hypothetical protein [Clostridia bacterium]
MEEITKKINKFMTITMGITISIILSTLGVVMSGHFSVPTLIISMVCSIIIALLIGFLIPIRKLIEVICTNIVGIWEAIIDNFIMNLFYVLIITTINVFLMTTMAGKQIDKQIDSVNNDIVLLEEEISNETDEVVLKDKQDKLEELNTQVKEMNEAKPSFTKTLPKSLVSSFIISFILSFIFRYIYLNIAFKKYKVRI